MSCKGGSKGTDSSDPGNHQSPLPLCQLRGAALLRNSCSPTALPKLMAACAPLARVGGRQWVWTPLAGSCPLQEAAGAEAEPRLPILTLSWLLPFRADLGFVAATVGRGSALGEHGCSGDGATNLRSPLSCDNTARRVWGHLLSPAQTQRKPERGLQRTDSAEGCPLFHPQRMISKHPAKAASGSWQPHAEVSRPPWACQKLWKIISPLAWLLEQPKVMLQTQPRLLWGTGCWRKGCLFDWRGGTE